MTKVEKKAQPYPPSVQLISKDSSQSENQPYSFTGLRRTLTMVNRQCKGTSLDPGGPQPYPLTKPRHSLLLCTFILASAKLTFLSFRHSFTDSIHFFFGLPAGRFPTHSPQYILLTLTDYHSSFPHDQTISTYFHSFSRLPLSSHNTTL